jgi:hypothetical protein
MIRFAWLQSRTQTAVALVGLAVAAVALALTGPNLVHLYNTIIAPCTANGNCSPTTVELFLQNHSSLWSALGILVIVVPGILGIFWGAPLVAREIESGTYRLAWAQSVSRTRWLAVKLGLVALTCMAIAGVLSWIVTWWASPLDRVRQDVFATFEQRDIVPIGYAAFAFALGVAAGVLIRRTLPAMATVAVVFTAARVATSHWVRPLLLAPAHLTAALDPTRVGFGRTNSGPNTLQPEPPHMPNAWVYSTHIVDNSGHVLTPEVLASTCPNIGLIGPPPGGGPSVRAQVPTIVKDTLQDCIRNIGAKYHEAVTYQPASRYWAFQWYELGIYLAAAAVLAGICIWSIRRRRT